jgi:hypothetical protein
MKKNLILINPEKAKEVITDLAADKAPMSLTDFIREYFDIFLKSQKNIKEIYEYLKNSGVDVGLYDTFRRTYRKVWKARRESDSVAPVQKEVSVSAFSKESFTVQAVPSEKHDENLGLRKIYAADGTELEINPETGGRMFKVERASPPLPPVKEGRQV